MTQQSQLLSSSSISNYHDKILADDEQSVISDLDDMPAIMNDLESQLSSTSIWSPEVVDQVKASLRRINLHSSHSKDRLQLLKPLVHRREKTPSRATVMIRLDQPPVVDNDHQNRSIRDSKDRQSITKTRRSNNLDPINILRGRRVNTAQQQSSQSMRHQVSISTFSVNFHSD